MGIQHLNQWAIEATDEATKIAAKCIYIYTYIYIYIYIYIIKIQISVTSKSFKQPTVTFKLIEESSAVFKKEKNAKNII